MKQYEKIYEYVIDRGYHSITNFCREFGISPTVFSDLKQGKTKSLSTKNLRIVSEALNISVDDILADSADEDELLNFTYSDYVALCEEKNISRTKAAELAKVSTNTITRWKKGENTPTYPSKKKLVSVLQSLPSVNKNPETNNKSSLSVVPIYGSIHAGSPTIAQQEIIGYNLTDRPNPDEYFILTVNGDSMEPIIPNKTKVLVKKQNTADDGDIVACIVDGEEATLKRIKFYGQNTIFLLPENNKYEPIQLKQSDFENGQAFILGVVKQCIKDF